MRFRPLALLLHLSAGFRAGGPRQALGGAAGPSKPTGRGEICGMLAICFC